MLYKCNVITLELCFIVDMYLMSIYAWPKWSFLLI